MLNAWGQNDEWSFACPERHDLTNSLAKQNNVIVEFSNLLDKDREPGYEYP